MTSSNAVPEEPQPVQLSRVYARRERHRRRRLPVRIAAAVAGFLVLAAGVAMTPFFPEGAIVLAVAALGILALEFDWAARALTWTLRQATRFREWWRRVPWWVNLLGLVLFLAIVAGIVLKLLGRWPF